MLERANETRAKKAQVWQRDDLDWYVEPESVTDALLSRETFCGRVLDPSCGQGNIVRAMRRHGIAAFGSDVMHRGLSLDDGWIGEHDFLQSETHPCPNLVFNPPFFRAAGAEAFIWRALSVATKKVAAFVDIRFIAGSKRAAGIFQSRPPSRIYVISPRPSCPPGSYLQAGGIAGNGTSDWCWLVWDLVSPSSETHLRWLSRPAKAEFAEAAE